MEPEKRRLLERIDRDRERLIAFLQEFIRCPTPNPPGDTRMAARHVQKLLDTHGVAYRVIAPNVIMPNIVANISADKPTRRLHAHEPERYGHCSRSHGRTCRAGRSTGSTTSLLSLTTRHRSSTKHTEWAPPEYCSARPSCGPFMAA